MRRMMTREGVWCVPETTERGSPPAFTGSHVKHNLMGAEAERRIGLHSILDDSPCMRDLVGNEFPLIEENG